MNVIATCLSMRPLTFPEGIPLELKGTKNQTKTAELLRCPKGSFRSGFSERSPLDRVINRIMHLSCQRGLQRRDMKSASFERLSIDEKSFKKGHQYVSVLSDPASGCVLDVVEGRDKNSCKQLLTNALTDKQRAEVKQVSMDMWKAFMSGCADPKDSFGKHCPKPKWYMTASI